MSVSEAFKALSELRKEYYTYIKPLLERVLSELERLNENIERLNENIERLREWKK